MTYITLVISLLSVLLATISLIITWQKNIRDRQYSEDKELLEQLKQSLYLAYHSLLAENDVPSNIKHKWLTSARHIARYRKLRTNIVTPVFKIICEEQEEFWRDKFYSLLKQIKDSEFYGSVSKQMDYEYIEPRSAAIVHSFSVWKDDRDDPLDDMDFEDIVSKYHLFSPLHRPFELYIKSKYPNLAKKVK